MKTACSDCLDVIATIGQAVALTSVVLWIVGDVGAAVVAVATALWPGV